MNGPKYRLATDSMVNPMELDTSNVPEISESRAALFRVTAHQSADDWPAPDYVSGELFLVLAPDEATKVSGRFGGSVSPGRSRALRHGTRMESEAERGE